MSKAGVRIVEEYQVVNLDICNDLVLTVDSAGALHIDPDQFSTIRFGGELWDGGHEIVLPEFSGSVAVRLYQANDSITLGGSFPGAVSVNLGSGSDKVVVDSASIGGKLTLAGGRPTEDGEGLTVTVKGATIYGALKILGGAAYDELKFADNTSVYGNVDVRLGGNNNEVHGQLASLFVGGNSMARSGSGNDTFDWNGGGFQVKGNMSFSTGAGYDSVDISTAEFTVDKKFLLRSVGAVDDPVDQEVIAADIVIGGALTMQTTVHSAFQEVRATGSLTVGRDVKFLTGKTSLSLSDENTSLLKAGESLNISGKVFAISADFISDFEISALVGFIGGGVKSSRVTVTLSMAGTIDGNIDMDGAGYVSIGWRANEPNSTLDVRTITSTGNNGILFFHLYNVVIKGGLKVTGSNDEDRIYIENTTFAAPGVVDLGGGNDKFFIETDAYCLGKTEVGARLTLRGGSGKDIFTLSGSEPANPLNATASIVLDGGAGADQAVLGETGDYQNKLLQKSI